MNARSIKLKLATYYNFAYLFTGDLAAMYTMLAVVCPSFTDVAACEHPMGVCIQ